MKKDKGFYFIAGRHSGIPMKTMCHEARQVNNICIDNTDAVFKTTGDISAFLNKLKGSKNVIRTFIVLLGDIIMVSLTITQSTTHSLFLIETEVLHTISL